MKSNILIGFIIRDLISIEKKSEYEILLIYVDNKFHKRGFTSYLINALKTSSFIQPWRKIILEVSKSNTTGFNLDKKNK